jgi:alpha-beta hydrolase superfamily lysophospholipase
MIIYPEARHEMFNELNKHEVLADLTNWLDTSLEASR